MKRRVLVLILVLCQLLSGCSWLGGSYVNVTPHQEQTGKTAMQNQTASNYAQLVTVLENMVSEAVSSGIIHLADYSVEDAVQHMDAALGYIRNVYPIGAYAVDDIVYEIGTSGGRRAIAVDISYHHSYMEIHKIQKAADMEEAAQLIGEALKSYAASVVIQVEQYQEEDFAQLVQDYAEQHPESIMEIPRVTYETYGTGESRVIEMNFAYENSRDALRQMQAQVQPVFEAAALYVGGDGTNYLKFSQLYAFLMKRYDYEMETSITPAYSLLQHGVGDSRAFAVVYAAMCRAAGLECQVITGTRNGDPWSWNIVRDNGRYYHVDLLLCSKIGRYWEYADGDMIGYVWDYSAYPECVPVYNPKDEEDDPEDTEPTEEETRPTEETEPEKPILPVEPTVPPETTEPEQPSIPWWPSEPTDPTEPTEPEEPEEPVWPWWPSEPTEPTEPTEPSESTEPTEATQPADPTAPEEETQATEMTEPLETSAPTEESTAAEIFI